MFVESLPCPQGNFECGTPASRRCIQTIHVCDGQSDCPNEKDEDIVLCGKNLAASTATDENQLYLKKF